MKSSEFGSHLRVYFQKSSVGFSAFFVLKRCFSICIYYSLLKKLCFCVCIYYSLFKKWASSLTSDLSVCGAWNVLFGRDFFILFNAFGYSYTVSIIITACYSRLQISIYSPVVWLCPLICVWWECFMVCMSIWVCMVFVWLFNYVELRKKVCFQSPWESMY